MTNQSNYFEALSRVDCSAHVEKKGKFSYLSWPFAVAELKKRHPTATWEVKKHEGCPYVSTPAGCFVEVEVDVEGVKLSQIHPVLNHQNKTVEKPDAFQVNTSIQRCLVKAIALHGLGLYIYAGEDLPEVDSQTVVDLVAACNTVGDLITLSQKLPPNVMAESKAMFSARKAQLEEGNG